MKKYLKQLFPEENGLRWIAVTKKGARAVGVKPLQAARTAKRLMLETIDYEHGRVKV